MKAGRRFAVGLALIGFAASGVKFGYGKFKDHMNRRAEAKAAKKNEDADAEGKDQKDSDK